MSFWRQRREIKSQELTLNSVIRGDEDDNSGWSVGVLKASSGCPTHLRLELLFQLTGGPATEAEERNSKIFRNRNEKTPSLPKRP